MGSWLPGNGPDAGTPWSRPGCGVRLPRLAAALLAAVPLLAVPLTASPATPAAGPARVAAVRFAPAAGVGPYRFAELVAVRPGDPLTPELLERNVRLLRATGLFAEVAAEVVEGPAGPAVLFTLRPLPLVTKVGIKGNFLVLERQLLPVLRLRPAEPLREEVVRADVERLLRHYEEQGYDGTRVSEQIARDGDEIRVTYRIAEGRPRIVREVVLRGNRGLAAAEIGEALAIIPYSFFRGADLQHALDRLRDLYQRRGYVDVRVDATVAESAGSLGLLAMLANPVKGLLTLAPGGYQLVTVTVAIEEGRRYSASFSGVTAVRESELQPLLTFQRSGFFDPEEVEAGRERILAYYQERGYYLAEVDPEADYEAGRVTYVVRENRQVPVARVRLSGFTHFAEDWVLQRLATRAVPGREAALLRAPQLERDRLRIRSWYLDAGFTRVEVPPPEVWPEAGPDGAVVTFSVREGARSLVRYVSFVGNVALPAARLRAASGVVEGQPYRAAELQAAADRVRAACARAGYPRCVVTARPDYSEDRSSVDVRFTVQEGRLQRLGGIAVTGNARTRRGVILRELPVEPGDPFDPEAFAEGKQRLYELGLFREVRYVMPEPVSPEAPQDLVVAVRERPTGFVGFGLGYATDERFRGFVEAGDQNLFGTGRGLRWKSKVSSTGYRHDLFYQEPWILGFRLDGQADVYLESRSEEGYDVQRRGLTAGVNREFERQVVLNLRYRYELVDYSDVDPEIAAELGPLESFNIGSVIAAVDYDRRDNPVLPRRGSYHAASVEIARPAFGGDTSFTKYQLETAWYLPLRPGIEVALGLRGGFTQLNLQAADLPLSERFFLGGDNSVRGYAHKDIGPKDADGNPLGGNAFAQGNAELRFPLHGKLRGVVFLDAGELWAGQAGLPSSGLKSSVGAGLRYETLVGPIRLDWGYKLDPEPGEPASRWHLTVGYPF